MGETMTSEQRAAVAVHNATQNRMCLNLSGNGQICVACSEVADQIDSAVEVGRQRSQEALAAANARADAAARARDAAASEGVLLREQHAEALAAARRECTEQREAKEAAYAKLYQTLAMLDRLPDGTVARDVRAALAAPAAGEEGT